MWTYNTIIKTILTYSANAYKLMNSGKNRKELFYMENMKTRLFKLCNILLSIFWIQEFLTPIWWHANGNNSGIWLAYPKSSRWAVSYTHLLLTRTKQTGTNVYHYSLWRIDHQYMTQPAWLQQNWCLGGRFVFLGTWCLDHLRFSPKSQRTIPRIRKPTTRNESLGKLSLIHI